MELRVCYLSRVIVRIWSARSRGSETTPRCVKNLAKRPVLPARSARGPITRPRSSIVWSH